MRDDLKKAIEEWKTKTEYEVRDVVSKNTTGSEYILVISESVDLAFEGQTQTVTEFVFFLTHGQSSTSRYSSDGDVYRFKKITAVVENRFLGRCSDVLKDLVDRAENGLQAGEVGNFQDE